MENKSPLIIREADFLALTAPATSPADLLNRLLTGRLRSTALLDPFAGGFTNGWACCLPAAMRPALDIRQTVRIENRIERLVWIQGKSFGFSVGDTLYDCQQAYELPWAEALHHIGYCLQVREVFADVVGFDILIPDPEKKALIKQQRARATQTEFARLLITGTCSGIENDAG